MAYAAPYFAADDYPAGEWWEMRFRDGSAASGKQGSIGLDRPAPLIGRRPLPR